MKVFLLLALFFTHALTNEYKEVVNIALKKDEHKKILIRYGKAKRLFQFRWTLYANGGLVIFRSYDKIVAQNILYLRHKNQSFRVELKTRGASNYNVPYILVKFIEYNYQSNTAKFQLFLSDKHSEINLEYFNNK